MKGYKRQNVAELLPGDMYIEIHAETLCGIQSLWWGWAVINYRTEYNYIFFTLKASVMDLFSHSLNLFEDYPRTDVLLSIRSDAC